MRRSTARPLRFLLLLTVAPLALATASLAQQHPPRKDHKKVLREQVEAMEQQWRTAQLNDDVPGMDKLLSDDFLGITANGQLNTKAQFLERMRNRELVLTTLTLSDIKVKLIGQIAIVTSFAQIDGMSDNAPLQGSFRYTRIYQRLPSGVWKITNFEATRIPLAQRRQAVQTVGPHPPPATPQQ